MLDAGTYAPFLMSWPLLLSLGRDVAGAPGGVAWATFILVLPLILSGSFPVFQTWSRPGPGAGGRDASALKTCGVALCFSVLPVWEAAFQGVSGVDLEMSRNLIQSCTWVQLDACIMRMRLVSSLEVLPGTKEILLVSEELCTWGEEPPERGQVI